MLLVLGLLAIFTVLSGFMLNRDRLLLVVRTALEQGELPHTTRTDEDFFTECALLEMQYLRPAPVLLNAVETLFLQAEGVHPCQSLRTMVAGTEMEKARLPAPTPYVNYHFGSRYLEAFTLSVLEYPSAAAFYQLLSYCSVLLLFVAMLWHSARMALILSPIPVFLLFGFALHVFGHNLAHAPGFFVGFFALAVFTGAKKLFRDLPARFCFFGALGVVTADFDNLTGSIPVILCLSIVLNHFLYAKRDVDPARYMLSAAAQGAGIAACFTFGYLLLTVLRLELLASAGVPVGDYLVQLRGRVGSFSYSGPTVGYRDVASALWRWRFQLTPGGAEPATWLLYFAASSWIFALLAWPMALRQGRNVALVLMADMLVIEAAGSGIFAWFMLFPGHTYTHAGFMVSMIALPAAYGVVAALLVARTLSFDRLGVTLLPGAVIASALLGGILTDKKWDESLGATISFARFVEAPSDVVSCVALGLRPDGMQDGVVEFRYRRAKSPAALLGFREDNPVYISVERFDPPGAYETGARLFVLGIAASVGGKLLNRPDGSYRSTSNGEQNLYAHFCWDGHDTPESVYRLNIDSSRLPISAR
jgi:hypothetical protein